MERLPIHRFLAALVVGLGLIVAACGSSDSPSSDESAGAAATDGGDAAQSEDDAPTSEDSTEDGEEDAVGDSMIVVDPEPALDDASDDDPAEDETPATPQPVLSSTEDASVDPVVYADDFGTSILPILADKCASCHGEVGPGASHWRITTAQDAVDTHLLIRGVVESNYMPPWPASDASIPFAANRDLRPDQVAAIVAWSDAGAPIDVDPTTPIEPAEPVVGLVDPDLVIVPAEPYAGDPGTVDDYRCQIYDPQLPEGGWITGYEFIPDETTVVHHAIGYVIEPDRAGRAADRDGEDGRPGWECYGSSGLGGDDLFLGWAPGQDPSVLPEGAGLYLPPGAFLVVQIHYHYEGEAPPDASGLALLLHDSTDPDALDPVTVATLIAPAEIPCAEWESGPLCDRDAALADALERFGDEGVQTDQFNAICGYDAEDFAHFTQGTAESACYLPAGAVGANGEVLAVLGHMHEIGSWMRITLNPDTPDETVLLDIPDWDFDWQYNYVPADPLRIGIGDSVLLECGWDRARRDPSLEPAYILWADGTNDEMCFATITVTP